MMCKVWQSRCTMLQVRAMRPRAGLTSRLLRAEEDYTLKQKACASAVNCDENLELTFN